VAIYAQRQTLWLTQGDPHRIFVTEYPTGTTARIQIRNGSADESGLVAEYVADEVTPEQIIYLLSGEETSALDPGSGVYVWEMELLYGDESETVVRGGVVVQSETARAV
jgi:hypothetical protein